jgi:sec-independent protein translocase protein TatC
MQKQLTLDLIARLEEIRSRLLISLAAVLVTSALAYVFSDAILHLLIAPAGGIAQLLAFSPMDGFMIRFRVALYGGLVLAAPVWIFQLLGLLTPALKPNEKRLVIPGVLATVILFLLGNLFGYLMLANMMTVLLAMFGAELNYLPRADQYISFIVNFLIAAGIAFELPVMILILVKTGLVSPQALRKQRKIAYFIIFVFAELVTPVADPIIAPLTVMIPMVILFELALFATRFLVPKPMSVEP